MKKRVYDYIRNYGKNDEPPSPRWVRLLWLLAIIGFIVLAWYVNQPV